jgi:hypothetical protein
VDDGVQEFLDAGVEPAQIDGWRAEMEGGDDDMPTFAVFPCNWDAVMVFRRTAYFGFWHRVGPDAVPVNLNDDTVLNIMRMMGRENDLDLFDQVMTIGGAAAAALR